VETAEAQRVKDLERENKEHARQEIPYTDFPMLSISLYAYWDGRNWVIMLPSEY